MAIDLHNLIEQEAIGVILSAFLDLEISGYEEIEFITGRGSVLRSLVIDLAEEQDFFWEFDGSNEGIVIVYAK